MQLLEAVLVRNTVVVLAAVVGALYVASTLLSGPELPSWVQLVLCERQAYFAKALVEDDVVELALAHSGVVLDRTGCFHNWDLVAGEDSCTEKT